MSIRHKIVALRVVYVKSDVLLTLVRLHSAQTAHNWTWGQSVIGTRRSIGLKDLYTHQAAVKHLLTNKYVATKPLHSSISRLRRTFLIQAGSEWQCWHLPTFQCQCQILGLQSQVQAQAFTLSTRVLKNSKPNSSPSAYFINPST